MRCYYIVMLCILYYYNAVCGADDNVTFTAAAPAVVVTEPRAVTS